MERGPVRRRSQLRMPHRLAPDGPPCYAAEGSRFGCNGPAYSAPSTTLSRRARLRKIIPRQVALKVCIRLVNPPTAPATCSVWSESPDVRARNVRGRRAARLPFSEIRSRRVVVFADCVDFEPCVPRGADAKAPRRRRDARPRGTSRGSARRRAAVSASSPRRLRGVPGRSPTTTEAY